MTEKQHLGNLKLSESKKAIKIHLFKPERFLVIPINELSHKNTVGRVLTYIDGEAEIVGEIYPQANSKYHVLKIDEDEFFIKSTYIELLLKGSELVLVIQEV